MNFVFLHFRRRHGNEWNILVRDHSYSACTHEEREGGRSLKRMALYGMEGRFVGGFAYVIAYAHAVNYAFYIS